MRSSLVHALSPEALKGVFNKQSGNNPPLLKEDECLRELFDIVTTQLYS